MLTDRFCFVHIPRMGGSAFKALCAAYYGPVLGNPGHLTGPELAWLSVPKVALLRDPWSWYRSVTAQRDLVGSTVEATYAATVQRYLSYPGGTSRAVDRVYRWPWLAGVQALLQDAGAALLPAAALEQFRALRATPADWAGCVSAPTTVDVKIWDSYGHSV